MNRANRTETEAETERIDNYNPVSPRKCLRGPDIMLTVSFLSSRFNCDLLEPKEPFISFVASYQPHSAVP